MTRLHTEEEEQTGGYIEDYATIPAETRDVIVRVANCIKLLASNFVPLFDTTITQAYAAALNYPTKELIKRTVADEIAAEVSSQMTEGGIVL